MWIVVGDQGQSRRGDVRAIGSLSNVIRLRSSAGQSQALQRRSVTVESRSEPNVANAVTPPLNRLAVLTPGREEVNRMTVAEQPIRAHVAAGAIDLITDRQSHMHRVETAGLQSAAPRLPPLMVEDLDVHAVGGIEACIRATYHASTVLTGSEMPA